MHHRKLAGEILSALVSALLLAGLNLNGQTITGTIVGRVLDSTGAVIPDARIAATNQDTGYTRETTTDPSGLYTLALLPYGTYKIEATKAGFSDFTRSGIILRSNESIEINFELAPAALKQSVEVIGQTPLLQTQTSSVKAPVYDTQIKNLPLNSRSPVDLVLLQPSGNISGQARSGQFLGFTFNGQNTNGSSLRMDGTDASIITDPTLTQDINTSLVLLSVDAIQEFDLGSGNYAADVRGSGGYVNVVTKSGTNQFHLTLFEFLRNGALDARNFFQKDRGSLKLNDFGAVVGGPIQRDKTFFMASYEGQRVRLPFPGFANVPTASFRQQVDPRLQPILDLTPLPTEPIPGDPDVGIFRRNALQTTRQDVITTRIDHSFSQKDSVFGRYSIEDTYRTGPNTASSALRNRIIFPGYLASDAPRHQLGTLSWSHTFSPSVLNDFRLGVNRWRDIFSQKPEGGSPFTSPPNPSVPGLVLGGGAAIQNSPNTAGSIEEKISWVNGRHTLKFGASYMGAIFARVQASTISLSFPSLQAFKLDKPSSASSFFGLGLSIPGNHWSNQQIGLFIQDDFRVNPRLTLNTGLRYDNWGVMKESRNRALNIQRDPLGPFRNPSDPLYERNNLDFGPRFGFSYRPFGGKNFVVRGGYGVFWGGLGSLEESVFYSINTVNNFTVTSADNPALAWPLDLATLKIITGSPGRFPSDPFAPDFYTQQWNLTTEHQIGSNSIITVAYVGNHTVHTPGADAPNAIDPLLGGRRPAPTLGNVSEEVREDSTTYNSLQASFRHRMSHSVALDVFYSWSHSVGILSGVNEISTGIGSGSEQLQTVKNRGLAHGTLPSDLRHSFTGDFTYEFPRIHSTNRIVAGFFDRWNMSGIIIASSGLPFNIVTGRDTRDARFIQRPNLVPGVAPIINGVSPADGFVNLAAFAAPTSVDPKTGLVLGNLANNVLRNRRFFNVDWNLAKTFKVREKLDISFRAEFFNLLNKPNFGLPVGNMAAGTFGKSQSASDPRQIQFALKLSF